MAARLSGSVTLVTDPASIRPYASVYDPGVYHIDGEWRSRYGRYVCRTEKMELTAAARPRLAQLVFLAEWSQMCAYKKEAVLSLRRWNRDPFGFAATSTWDLSFRIKNRQFPAIGLEAGVLTHHPAGTELALETVSVSTHSAAPLEKSGNAVRTRERKQSPLPFRRPLAECPGCLPHPCLGFGACYDRDAIRNAVI